MTPKIIFSIAVASVSLVAILRGPQEPADQDREQTSSKQLVVEYNKTKMDLAQLELDYYEERLGGSVHQPRLERRKTDLVVARKQYEQAQLASSGSEEMVRLCHAREKVRLAELDLEAFEKSRETEAVSDYKVRRAELRLQLAKLNLALLSNPQNHPTIMEALQAQLDRLSEEILELDLRVTNLETRHR